MSDQSQNYAEKLRKLSLLIKQKEKQWGGTREKLEATVEHLAQAAQGQDESLDHLIAELRVNMRNGEPGPVLLNQLETSARSMTGIRRSRAQKQLQGFSDCVAQLLQLDPPPDIKKQLAGFVRQARRVIADPAQQELMPIKFAKVQGCVLEPYRQASDVGEEQQQSDAEGNPLDAEVLNIEDLVEDDTLEGLPPFSKVAEHIEAVLLDLVVQIRPPEEARAALDKARQILSAGLNWYELAALLEQLSIVLITALDTDQQEFELFLQLLNERLTGLGSEFNEVDGTIGELFSSGDDFDDGLRQDMQSFAHEMAGAGSLEVLKGSVRNHLDSVLGQLDQFKHERERQHEAYNEEIEVLRARVVELEKDAEQARQEIEAKQKRSERDSLTTLPNREAYDRRLELELGRYTRYSRSFSLVVADIDHFKKINDSYGHLAGDKVLKVIAKTIRQRLRRVDFMARYGGEEFVIILPETPAEVAFDVINKIREQVSSCPFHFNNDPLNITVSMGVTEVIEGDDDESIFARADKALYAAKAGGRNRCELAQAPLDKSA